jgi:hypothetical protein
MTKKLLFVISILCVLTFAAMAADVSGKWTWEQAGRQGGNPTTVTLTLKVDGGKLTGTMDAGRGGPTEISDGHVDGNSISFSVKRSMGGNDIVTPYKGIVNDSGDSMKIDFTRPGRGGAEPTPQTVTAKRATT